MTPAEELLNALSPHRAKDGEAYMPISGFSYEILDALIADGIIITYYDRYTYKLTWKGK